VAERSAEITAVVVNWNGGALLGECLASLRSQTRPPRTVIVVDNGSRDGSPQAAARTFPEARWIRLQENRGFAAANNLALARVQTPLTALLNNDAVAHPRWLEHLAAALEAHPAAGSAASRMLYRDRPAIIDRAGDGYSRAGAGVLRGRGLGAEAFAAAGWVFGACAGAALYRTAMLRELGGFDERFFLLYEDVDLSFRAQLAGFGCRYVPQALVYHGASRSIGYDSPRAVYYGHRNLEWVYCKNMPTRLLARSLAGHILYDAAALAYFAARGLAGPYLRAKRDALREMAAILRQRVAVQRCKRITDAQLWTLISPESWTARLTRRLARGSGCEPDRPPVRANEKGRS
jgi:hypothetical protein